MLEPEGATADEVKTDEVVDAPKSMDDTIRDALRGMKERDTATAAPDTSTAVTRDDKGKFAPKPGATIGEIESPIAGAAPEAPQIKPAPNTWKREVADKWATLPPEVQAEVERREADFHRGIEQYKGAAQFAQQMHSVLEPHAHTLKALNVSPEVAVRELLEADSKLRYGQPEAKRQYFAALAKSYGIDLNGLSEMPVQQVDPYIGQMYQEVQSLKQQLAQRSQQDQQQADATLNSEIARFSADPTHSHFESVKGHMAALLQAGQATDLQSAYEQAVYANPQTRTLVIAEQQAKERAELQKKAQAAKQAASINVRNRPSMPSSQPIGSMDETIRATLRRLQQA